MQFQRFFSIQILTQYELILGHYCIGIDKFLSDELVIHKPWTNNMRVFYFWVKKDFVKYLFYFSLRAVVRVFVQ